MILPVLAAQQCFALVLAAVLDGNSQHIQGIHLRRICHCQNSLCMLPVAGVMLTVEDLYTAAVTHKAAPRKACLPNKAGLQTVLARRHTGVRHISDR